MASKNDVFLVLYIILLSVVGFAAAQNAVNGGYWFPESGFAASDIDSTLFTHLFYAFADLDPQTNKLTIPTTNSAIFSQFTTIVQRKNPLVKTLLSVGGGNANKTAFTSMASRSASRKSFIDSSLALARSNNFVGLDLDWEYPQTSTDMTNMGKLLDEWRAAVVAEATSSGKPRLLLAAAVSFRPTVNGLNYPVQSISRSLDWINVMAYDFYGPTWSSVTNAPAQLYDPSGQQVSGSNGIGSWIQSGLNPKKLVLGMPFYGYAWLLVDPSKHGLLAPGNGPAPISRSSDGTIGYNDIRNFIANNDGVSVYNATIVSDYWYARTTWIGYDDTQSVATKVLYAKQKGLLGYFAWHVGVDQNWALSKQAKQSWGTGPTSTGSKRF